MGWRAIRLRCDGRPAPENRRKAGCAYITFTMFSYILSSGMTQTEKQSQPGNILVTEPADAWRKQLLSPEEVPFDTLARAFGQAETRCRAREFGVRIAGFPVMIRIVGNAWADVVEPAISHLPRLSEDCGAYALTIEAWDVSETGVLPDHAASLDQIQSLILLKSSADGTFIGEERRHGSAWLDRNSNRMVSFIRDVHSLNLDERARPFHKLLSAWLMDREIQFVHAGLIEYDGKGLLFVGNGGAGKSTSSISCLLGGMGFLGDDFIALGRVDGRFVGFGLYASCLLNEHHIKRFPALERFSRPGHYDVEDKHIVYLSELYPKGLQCEVPISALIMPRVVGKGPNRLRAASKGETLFAIAPTSVMLLPRPSKWAFERLSLLVEETPCYWLELGEHVSEIPDAVRLGLGQAGGAHALEIKEASRGVGNDISG